MQEGGEVREAKCTESPVQKYLNDNELAFLLKCLPEDTEEYNEVVAAQEVKALIPELVGQPNEEYHQALVASCGASLALRVELLSTVKYSRTREVLVIRRKNILKELETQTTPKMTPRSRRVSLGRARFSLPFPCSIKKQLGRACDFPFFFLILSASKSEGHDYSLLFLCSFSALLASNWEGHLISPSLSSVLPAVRQTTNCPTPGQHPTSQQSA